MTRMKPAFGVDMRRVVLILIAATAVPAAAQFRMPGSDGAGGASPGIQPGGAAPGIQPGGAAPGLQPRVSDVPPKPASAAARRGPELVDRIVAIVNKEVITQRDLAERMRLIETQLKRQGTPLPTPDV